MTSEKRKRNRSTSSTSGTGHHQKIPTKYLIDQCPPLYLKSTVLMPSRLRPSIALHIVLQCSIAFAVLWLICLIVFGSLYANQKCKFKKINITILVISLQATIKMVRLPLFILGNRKSKIIFIVIGISITAIVETPLCAYSISLLMDNYPHECDLVKTGVLIVQCLTLVFYFIQIIFALLYVLKLKRKS
ncbi:hypothetical protein GJ496_010586 [Pomphorhynchus laevis]|nr:hypothetical protein GJ496_010586 [Pomphorhynchus laevis]